MRSFVCCSCLVLLATVAGCGKGQENASQSTRAEKLTSSRPIVSGFPVERQEVYDSRGKSHTPSLTALDKEAIQRALDFWKPLKSGESYYLRFVRRPKDLKRPHKGEAVIQLRQVSIKISPSTISEADRLNGIEWRGRVELRYQAGRYFVQDRIPMARLGGGYERPHPPDTKWSDWESDNTLAFMDFERVNSKWETASQTSGIYNQPPRLLPANIGSGTIASGGSDDCFEKVVEADIPN